MCAVTQAFKTCCSNTGERGCQGSARLLVELGTERGVGIPGVQKEWKGIPGRGEHVPRYIKVSAPGESVWQEGREEGRAGIWGLYRPAYPMPFGISSCLANDGQKAGPTGQLSPSMITSGGV